MKGIFSLFVGLLILIPLNANISWMGGFMPTKNHAIRTIVIDPGHGGRDFGCSGIHSKEKDVNLAIAKRFGHQIQEAFPEIKVLYTRTSDKFVPLHERAALANDHQADVFISIHANAFRDNTHIHGTETYVMGLHSAEENLEIAKKNLAVATRENEAILLEDNYLENYDGYDPNSPETHILLMMLQNAHRDQSILLANIIEDQFKKHAKRKSRGVHQAAFIVLRATTMPSVLVETGFLTNPTEENYLNSREGQILISSALFRAFQTYKKKIEGDDSAILEAATHVPSTSPKATPKKINLNTSSPIEFKVQLRASEVPLSLNTTKWQRVQHLEVIKESDMYKYLAGGYSTFRESVGGQAYWRQNGFEDAFVVAYKHGIRISIQSAKRELGIK